MITLGNAAKQLGISKPTLSKAISKGQLSATRREDGSFSIDPAELMRWWDGVSHRFHPQTVSNLQEATPQSGSGNTSNTPVNTADTELRVLNAKLEADLAGMKELIRVHKDQIDDLRSERDKLLGQVDAAHRLLTHHKQEGVSEQPVKRGFLWFRRSA